MELAIHDKLTKFSNAYPHFADGRIDYTDKKEACAVVVFVMYQDKVLLMKRSEHVHWYKGKWDIVAGFYDELVEPQVKAYEELREEAGIMPEDIASITVGKMFARNDTTIGATWYNVPVLVTLKQQKDIVLDFEHTQYSWVPQDQISAYDLAVPFSVDFLRLFE